jgi:hypothetical protein
LSTRTIPGPILKRCSVASKEANTKFRDSKEICVIFVSFQCSYARVLLESCVVNSRAWRRWERPSLTAERCGRISGGEGNPSVVENRRVCRSGFNWRLSRSHYGPLHIRNIEARWDQQERASRLPAIAEFILDLAMTYAADMPKHRCEGAQSHGCEI